MKKKKEPYVPPVILGTKEERIKEFGGRTDKEFCEELFKKQTIRVLAFKYAYYMDGESLVDDQVYDLEEEDWYIMGRGLGHLKEDETSPCVGFDEKLPLAEEAIKFYKWWAKL